MNRFHHNREGFIIVTVGGVVAYFDTLANFTLDFGQAPPAIVAGADERIYEPGIRHTMQNSGGSVLTGGAMPWAFGDAALAGIADLVAAKADREAG